MHSGILYKVYLGESYSEAGVYTWNAAPQAGIHPGWETSF